MKQEPTELHGFIKPNSVGIPRLQAGEEVKSREESRSQFPRLRQRDVEYVQVGAVSPVLGRDAFECATIYPHQAQVDGVIRSIHGIIPAVADDMKTGPATHLIIRRNIVIRHRLVLKVEYHAA